MNIDFLTNNALHQAKRIKPAEAGCIGLLRPQDIDPLAFQIIEKLQAAGFLAYVVGGGVRDRLVGLSPKDYDVATNAHPEQICELFENCRLIGHRFRLAHVFERSHVVEVATFRRGHENIQNEEMARSHDGMILRDNVYGSLEEDAQRRDLTINALYYDPIGDEIIDFVGGLSDLKAGIIRLIGNPKIRFREDPVRILRAIRFANKLGFLLETETAYTLPEFVPWLSHIPKGRLFDEYLKIFLQGHAIQNFQSLAEAGVLNFLFPHTFSAIAPLSPKHDQMITLAMSNTDRRFWQKQGINPAFLLSVLLWPVLQQKMAEHTPRADVSPLVEFHELVTETLALQTQHMVIPARFASVIRQIWVLQHPLTERNPERVINLLSHPRFRAAYDFLLLRAESQEVPLELAQWWTQFQTLSTTEQAQQVNELPLPETPLPKNKRRRRRKK